MYCEHCHKNILTDFRVKINGKYYHKVCGIKKEIDLFEKIKFDGPDLFK